MPECFPWCSSAFLAYPLPFLSLSYTLLLLYNCLLSLQTKIWTMVMDYATAPTTQSWGLLATRKKNKILECMNLRFGKRVWLQEVSTTTYTSFCNLIMAVPVEFINKSSNTFKMSIISPLILKTSTHHLLSCQVAYRYFQHLFMVFVVKKLRKGANKLYVHIFSVATVHCMVDG